MLSFAEPKPPNGRGWLGGVITEADTLADAITGTHLKGINPGGSVGSIAFRATKVDPECVDRLFTDRIEWEGSEGVEGVELIPPPLTPDLIGTKPDWNRG